MKKLIVGNWKMNQTLTQVKEFFAAVNGAPRTHEAWIAPQTLHVTEAIKLAQMPIGAQNCADADSGALTGETSPAALQELGAAFVIIGHSERRQLFGEKDQLLARKTKHALSKGLAVIHCVGETLAEREAGKTLEVVRNQLRDGLQDVAITSSLVIAYEPVWAIGTGKVATPAQAQEVHAFIRQELTAMYGSAGTACRLLYGGSVKPDNVKELMAQPDIDGALVGGASLKSADFLALCQ